MNCNLSAVFSQALIFLALLPVRLWCLQRDSAKLLPWICKIQLIASDNKRLCIFILFWYFLSENILLHCLLLARSTNPTPEGPVCSSWAVAKPGFPGLLLEIRPLYLPSCVAGLHLREGWSVQQSTLRGFNHTDATIPCCLVGLFPGKALLEPYLPVLHIILRMQLSSAFYILHSSSWSVSGVHSAVWEVQQRQGQKTPSHLGARLWVAVHQVWALVPCAHEKLTWAFPRNFINYTAPKMSSSTFLCCMNFLQSKPPLPVQAVRDVVPQHCADNCNHRSCLVIQSLTAAHSCGTTYVGIFSTPGTSHKLCFPSETVPFTGEL